MRSEFDFIQNLKSKYGLEKIGDDCSVLPKDRLNDQIITADMLVEEVDFRLEWTTAEFLGHKALAVSLSDIAAMGGGPKWALLSIGIPRSLWKTDFIDKFYDGWQALAQRHGVELVGGDLSKTPDKVVIDSIVSGEVPKGKAILRSGARPGDSIYVTGELGGAAGALILLEADLSHDQSNEKYIELTSRQLRPTPQLDVGKQLLDLGLATSMIDISDGLSSDLSHICNASGVGAIIYSDKIPIDRNLSKLSLNAEQRLGLALNGGEDFELLFTADEKAMSQANLRGITLIGKLTSDTGLIKIINAEGTSFLPPDGFRHF